MIKQVRIYQAIVNISSRDFNSASDVGHALEFVLDRWDTEKTEVVVVKEISEKTNCNCNWDCCCGK